MAKVGCEWYHPTTLWRSRSSASTISGTQAGSSSTSTPASALGSRRAGSARCTRNVFCWASQTPPRKPMISVSDDKCAWKSISASASNEHVTRQGCSSSSYRSHSTICKSEVAPKNPRGGLRARRGRSMEGGGGGFGLGSGFFFGGPGGFETFGLTAFSFTTFGLGGFAASRAARSASLRARAAATAAPSPRAAAAARAEPSSAKARFSASRVGPARVFSFAESTDAGPRSAPSVSGRSPSSPPPPPVAPPPTYRTHFQPSSALRSGLTDLLNARENAETD